jgi:phage-related baseplate assembly protein
MANTIDLSNLPAPDIVEPLSFEAIRAQMLAELPPDYVLVESDPAVKILAIAAYRELMVRQRVNEGAVAGMPAKALGNDLVNLAALFGVVRLVLDPGDPDAGVPPVLEDIEDLRARMVLAPEGFSVAGPVGAYEFHARAADPDVLDVAVDSPAPAEVLLTVLSRVGDGEPSADLLTKVSDAVNADAVRPVGDRVTVQPATILAFAIEATLHVLPGPDASVVLATAQARLAEFLASRRKIGRAVPISGLMSALHVPGVERVALASPVADVAVDADQAAYCAAPVVTLAEAGGA